MGQGGWKELRHGHRNLGQSRILFWQVLTFIPTVSSVDIYRLRRWGWKRRSILLVFQAITAAEKKSGHFLFQLHQCLWKGLFLAERLGPAGHGEMEASPSQLGDLQFRHQGLRVWDAINEKVRTQMHTYTTGTLVFFRSECNFGWWRIWWI